MKIYIVKQTFLKEYDEYLPQIVAAKEYFKSGKLNSLCEFSSSLRSRWKEKRNTIKLLRE